MAFRAPFGRKEEIDVTIPADEEIVIDAEAVDGDEIEASAPGRAAIPRSAAVPEATNTHAVAKRSDKEIAVRQVAVATAGGVVAGAATIAVAAVARQAVKHAGPTPGLARRRKKDISHSQSFLIDVHVLKGR